MANPGGAGCRALLAPLLVGALAAAGCGGDAEPRPPSRTDAAAVSAASGDLDEAPPVIVPIGEIEIIDPWAKSAIGDHDAKLFFAFRNLGEADRLIGASSPIASGEARFRLVVADEGGRRVETLDHIAIPPTETPFELTEVGYYAEISGVQVPLTMGKELPVELHFERAGRADVVFPSRFHSPSLGRRIRAAVRRGDLEALRALRDPAEP